VITEDIKAALKKACQQFGGSVEPELTRPEEQFGDFSTNVALQLAKKIGKKPQEIAAKIVDELKGHGIKAEIAGPGFINIRLSDETLWQAAMSAVELPEPNKGQEILVEFGDPNPFKEMHIGHAYSYIVGDSIASILEASGAKVERLSYHGDVGLHVAKAIWGMKNDPSFDKEKIGGTIRNNIGLYYSKGSLAYERNEKAKAEIERINQQIYDRSDSEINELYDWGKQKSFGYFDQVLKDLGIHQAERFLESESAQKGEKLVEQNLDKVFEKSDGAIVYKGEKAGLHTRVFITSAGLPTYETKDLGLAELKKEAYPKANRSIIITAHEQAEYFKVMLAALKEFDPVTADMTTHIYHGFVSLSSGKMSSRSGEVYSAVDLMLDVDEAAKKQFKKQNNSLRNAAIKYGFLKHRLGSDIVYDMAESVSLEGNSGPYLQYAHARACSILEKVETTDKAEASKLDDSERSLARKISEYPEVFAKAANELAPSHVCNYLYELAQSFNRFYEKSRIIEDPREAMRLKLVKNYRDVLANGLNLLNIEAPEKV